MTRSFPDEDRIGPKFRTANDELETLYYDVVTMLQCLSCSASNEESSKFCSECGAALKEEYAPTETLRGKAAENDSVRPESNSSHHGRFLPGAKVADRYRIVSLVGKGGMGEVYRADDLKLGHTVALKFLPKDLAGDPRRLDYFHSEVRLTRQISHPNICRVYDIGEVDGQQFLSMEYIDGEDLRILLRRIGRLPKDKGVQTAQQLCAGLAAAHDRGVLHRDLKPANIMLDGHGQVRITDFGLAKLSDDGAAGDIAGTPAYMAPEQLSRGEATIQSDLYSLGLVLYEIFTGEAVYKTRSIPELMRAHEASTPSQPSRVIDDMDPVVERVILRCLENDPKLRPASAATVSASLPGGDPLAAAIAAGETPSPELVAASGENGALSFRVGTALLLAFGLFAILGVLLSDQLDRLALTQWNDQKPEVLEATARSISHTLTSDDESGRGQNVVDSAFGFERRNRNENSKPELLFWYRQGDSPLVPHPPNLMARPFMWDVTSSNPPLAPGMVSVKLAANGALVEFLRVEHQRVNGHRSESTKMLGGTESGTLEREAFQLAKLELDDFEILEDGSSIPWPPPVFVDAASIWKKKNVLAEDSPLVISGLRAGRLVYFRQFREAESVRFQSHQTLTSGRFDSRANLFLLVLVAFAIPLALRNLRAGRGDTKGALRLALCFFTIEAFLWLPALHHTMDLGSELRQATDYLIYAIAFSFRLWLYYIALEPYVRRLWPSALISSSRILSGQFCDPLVGRELLIGGAFGTGFGVATLAINSATERLSTYPLLGGHHALTSVLVGFQEAVMGVVAILVLLLIFRVCLRRPWLVFLAFAVAHMLLFTSLDAPPAVWAVGAFFGAAYAMLIIRFGIVACFSCHLCFVGYSLPLSAHVTQWYAETEVFYLGALLVIALFGYYTSTIAGRDWNWDPITGDAS